MLPTYVNIIASLLLGILILQMVVSEFPMLRYAKPALYYAMQISTAALAASSIVYIAFFVL